MWIGGAVLIAALAAAAPAAAAGPVVVELFTSQGCSSCPPADAYLGELASRPDVLALAFHVDYWNYIGWTDPFAAKWATQRQRDYARSLAQRYVYTPEIVVGGAAHEVGSDRAGVERLISAHRRDDGPRVALSRRADGAIALSVSAAPAQTPATLWLVRFDREHETPVLRGENGGRMLRNVRVVRAIEEIGGWSGQALELTLGPERLAGPGDGGCAVLVQAHGAGPILAAGLLAY
jgi:hypothetical protein